MGADLQKNQRAGPSSPASDISFPGVAWRWGLILWPPSVNHVELMKLYKTLALEVPGEKQANTGEGGGVQTLQGGNQVSALRSCSSKPTFTWLSQCDVFMSLVYFL